MCDLFLTEWDEQNSIVNVKHIKGVTIFYDDGAF